MLRLKQYKFSIHKNIKSYSRVHNCLINKKLIYKVCMRTMISSKSFYAIRALFNTAMMLSNTEMVDKINRQNTKPFVESAVDLALDHDKGALQHKTAILKHATNHKFPAHEFYEYFRKQTGHKNVHWEPNANVDCRTINEIGVFHEYLNTFGKDIEWSLATFDQRSSTFPHQKQPNVDFWVYINRALGLKSFTKGVFQDEKSGMDMLKHSTSGSIGLLTFDENGNNIQVVNEVITPQILASRNSHRILMLKEAMKIDGNMQFDEKLSGYLTICSEMQNKEFNDVVNLHNTLQDKLWKEVHCHLDVKRSLSFVFIKQIVTHAASPQEVAFSRVFRSHIQENKLYDLNKRQDFNILYKAMLYAGKEIDPQFVEKLEYIHKNGVNFNNTFLLVLMDALKHGL